MNTLRSLLGQSTLLLLFAGMGYAATSPILVAPTIGWPLESVSPCPTTLLAGPDGIVVRVGFCNVYSGSRLRGATVQASKDSGRTWGPVHQAPILPSSFPWSENVLAATSRSGIIDLYTSDAMLRRSSDGGLTFGDGLEVVGGRWDDSADYVAIATSPTGIIAVVRSKQDGGPWRVSRSLDGARSWTSWVELPATQKIIKAIWVDVDTLLVCAAGRDGFPSCARSTDRGQTFAVPPAPTATSDYITTLSSGRTGELVAQAVSVPAALPVAVTSHSTDGGLTWSALNQLFPVNNVVNAISASASGELWATVWTPEIPLQLYYSTDGIAWEPRGTGGGTVFATGPGRALRGGAPPYTLTTDAGRSWSEPFSPDGVYGKPIDGVALVRTPSGRLYAVWSDAMGGFAPVHAGWSDDRGQTWSRPTLVNDHPRAPSSFGFTAAAVGELGLAVAWPAADSLDHRVSVNLDGRRWEPSTHLTPIAESSAARAPDLISDSAGRLMAVWNDATRHPRTMRFDPDDPDRGPSWSEPREIAYAAIDADRPTLVGDEIVMSIGVGNNWQAAARTADLGQSWSFAIVPLSGPLVGAGRAMYLCNLGRCYHCPPWRNTFISLDYGATWPQQLSDGIDPNDILATDLRGHVYLRDGSMLSADGRLTRFGEELGLEVPFRVTPPQAIAREPLGLDILTAHNQSTIEQPHTGIYFSSFVPAGVDVLRASAALDQVAVASLFPLQPFVLDATSGQELESVGWQPMLTLYALDGSANNRLRAVERDSQVVLSW